MKQQIEMSLGEGRGRDRGGGAKYIFLSFGFQPAPLASVMVLNV